MIPKLEVNGVSYSYHRMDGETLALSHITFSVAAGEFLAIVGPSGCGKVYPSFSDQWNFYPPDKGEILLDKTPVQSAKSKGRIGYMFQRDQLFEWRSILSNACLGPELNGSLTPARKEKIASMLSDYGLGAFLSSPSFPAFRRHAPESCPYPGLLPLIRIFFY